MKEEEYILKGRVELLFGQFEEAIESFKQVPNSKDAISLMEKAKDRLEKHEIAIERFLEAIKKDKDNIDNYLERGLEYLDCWKRDEACKDFKKASDLGHKGAEELFNKYCLRNQ
ncbi:hypothetical protein [Flavobacterium sp. GNP002]